MQLLSSHFEHGWTQSTARGNVDHIVKKPAQSDRRTVNFSEGIPRDQDETGNEEFVDAQQDPELDSQLLVNAAAGNTQLNPADVCRALSVQKKKRPDLKIETNTHEVICSEAVPSRALQRHTWFARSGS